MCLHSVFLTQFYSHCVFETQNLQMYFLLTILMLIKAIRSYTMLLTQFYCHYASQIPGHALHEKDLQRQKGVGQSLFSRTCLAWKGFTETNRRRYTGQQSATKSARGLGDKPRINRLSIGRFVPSAVYIEFPLFVFAKRRSEQLFTARWRAREAVGFQGDRNVRHLVLPSVAPPRRPPCAVPTRPARCVSGFWTRQAAHDCLLVGGTRKSFKEKPNVLSLYRCTSKQWSTRVTMQHPEDRLWKCAHNGTRNMSVWAHEARSSCQCKGSHMGSL